MKYTLEERLEIGRRIYDGEISRYEAAEQFGINDQTARNYMRMYRDANQLPPKESLLFARTKGFLPFCIRYAIFTIRKFDFRREKG